MTRAKLHAVAGPAERSPRESILTLRTGLAWTAVLLWLPTTAYLTLADSVPRSLHSGLNSILGHVVMGLAVTATTLVLMRAINGGRRPSWRAVGAVVAASAGFMMTTEFLQSLTATRTPSWADVAADLFGVAMATLVVAGPFEPPWMVALRRGPAIPALGVMTAMLLVVTVATQPDQPRIRTGMATEAAGCIERLEHPNEPPAVADPAPSSGVQEGDAPPLLALDLTGVNGSTSQGVDADAGPVVFDVISGPEARLAERSAHGMTFDGGATAVQAREPVTDLIEALDKTEAFTITMVFAPADMDQEGPTRLLTISEGKQPHEIDLQLGVHHGWLSLRIRSACDIWNWLALSLLPGGEVRLAVTYDNGLVDAYINGRLTGHAELEGGDIGSWEQTRTLVIGNEVTGDRGFVGTISCVAIRDVAVPGATAVEASSSQSC